MVSWRKVTQAGGGREVRTDSEVLKSAEQLRNGPQRLSVRVFRQSVMVQQDLQS